MKIKFGILIKLSANILLAVAIFTCTVIDLAVSGALSWSLYVIFSVLLIWIPIMFISIKGIKWLNASLISFSVLLVPYMLFLETYTKSSSWFISLFLPIYAAAMIFMWAGYLFIRYSRISKLTLGAIFSFLGIPIVFFISFCVSRYTGEAIFDLWDLFSLVPLIILGITFVVIKTVKKSKEITREGQNNGSK